VYNLEVHGEHVYRIAVDGVLVHNAGPGHYAEWALFGPKGALIRAGDEISGLDFALPKGWKLSFPDQSWHGHTEGKLLSDLLQDGLLKPGRILNIEGQLPPCSNCQSLMKLISEKFSMGITYEDEAGKVWRWLNGLATGG
jgi:hypothetical protein